MMGWACIPVFWLFSVSDLNEVRIIWKGRTLVSYGKKTYDRCFEYFPLPLLKKRKKQPKKLLTEWAFALESQKVLPFFLLLFVISSIQGNLRKWCLYNLLIYIHYWTDVCFEDLSTISIIVKSLRLKQIHNKSYQCFSP